jgi:prepilin-type N-terminal cleavage/methylation domain-containing protein
MKLDLKKRPAFTLVELLVAAGIIAMLLALVAISYPKINEREQLTRAADKLKTGLLTARLWARRDNVVTGIRFEGTNPNYNGLLYVQQPMKEIRGQIINPDYDMSSSFRKIQVQILLADFYKIKKNEDFFLAESDLPHLIDDCDIVNSNQIVSLKSSLINRSFLLPHPFRVIRAAEPIPFQESNPFGDRITCKTSSTLASNQVCFLPNGQVQSPGATRLIFTLTQQQITPNEPDEELEIELDTLSGTTRFSAY